MSELVLYSGAYNGPQIDAAVSRALAGGALDKRIDAVAASPLVAATAADMTDQTRIYVYTGNEAGYTTGNWYYYDGSAWADGGTYQAAAADAALSDVSINPVQNRAVKAAIDLKADQTNLDTIQMQTLSAYITGTASGSVATFDDGADNIPVKDLTIGINPVQSGSGTPSSTNIRAITGWTGATVTRFLHNLIDYSSLQSGSIDSTTGQNVTSDTVIRTPSYLPVESSTQYRLTGVSSTIRIFWYGANFAYLGSATLSNNGVVLVPANCLFVRLHGLATVITSAISFRKSSEAVDYNCDTITVDWADEAGTVYGGILDVTTGLLTVTMANISSYAGETINEPWVSSMDEYVAGATPTTGAQVVYTLSAPVTYQLTAQEVTTLLGENNIYADTGDVNVTYRRDPTIAYNNLVNAIISLGGNV